MPFGADNALVKAAGVVQRLAEYRPPPRFHELWRAEVESMPLDDATRHRLLDEQLIEECLDELPTGISNHLYSCCHTTFSANVASTQTKTNVIPDAVVLDVDVRTMPGEGPGEVRAHLDEALGDLAEHVVVDPLIDDRASISPADTPLWDSLQRAVNRPFPASTLQAGMTVGFTDARVHRELGAVAYGAALLAPSLSASDFGRRFHGNDERIDVESLRLTTELWHDVAVDLLG